MICLRVSLSSLESIHLFYYSLATRVSRDLTPWLVRQYARWPMRRDRDLTVKGSRHLTFHITVKLTIKEEMLNLTCRQTFSFVATHLQGAHALELEEAAHPPPTRHGPAAAPRSSALRSTPSTMPPPLKICTAERAVCAYLKRLAGVRILRAARERLPCAFRGNNPRTNLRRVHRASCDD